MEIAIASYSFVRSKNQRVEVLKNLIFFWFQKQVLQNNLSAAKRHVPPNLSSMPFRYLHGTNRDIKISLWS
jgi:hypothetical protein